jgi:hypothetical protein
LQQPSLADGTLILSNFAYQPNTMKYLPGLKALFVAIILACTVGCGSGPNRVDAQLDSLQNVKPPSPKTFNDFLAQFKVQKAPCAIPDEAIKATDQPTVGIDYYDTYVVGPQKIFPASAGSAYKFYTYIRTDKPFHLVSFVEYKEDGLHYHLVTLTKDTVLKLIDRREVAFNVAGASLTHTKQARIDGMLVIDIQDMREEIFVPQTENEIRDRNNPVQRTIKNSTEKIILNEQGKFIIQQAGERF